MADRDVESGLELVLDNKKLIIFFLVLISIIGGFFVLGFIEGKRQGYREGSQAAAVLVPNSDPEGASLSETAANKQEPNAAAKSADPQNQSLDWYKKVNRPEQEAAMEKPPVIKTEESAIKTPIETRTSYSVQVGAFSQKKDAEIKAQLLKSKGFDSRVDSPKAPNQLYLLKVGKFSSRADAVAMELKLKNSGFKCFIKAN